ncbi:MAG: FimB/Mfa2 family fimbrial subunit [Dysgonamonadaceae bacterium]
MMSNRSKFSLYLVIIFLITGFLSSCFKEDLTDCPRPFQVTIKALDIDLNDITESGDVKNVILFMFDENLQLVDAFELNTNQIKNREPIDILIDYPGYESLFFVAWGNVDELVDHSNVSTVKELLDLFVKLKMKDGYAMPPGDLFRGNLTVPVEYGTTEAGQSQVVEIKRITSGVAITSIDLKEWNGSQAGTYSYVLHESYDNLDPNGNPTGNQVSYLPPSSFITNGNFTAPIFYVFPTTQGKSLVLDILFNGNVIFTANKDANGNPFNPQTGRTLNIILDFTAEIDIITAITPWNVVYQYVNL